jgi:hypothetical protein
MMYYEYMKNITILNDKIKDKDNLEQKTEVVFKRVANSFNLSSLPNISVLFHTSRLSFDKSLGRKTQVWEVGNTSRDNRIDIIHPNFFAKVSSHADSEFDQILAHEIAHIFINRLASGNQVPFWLNEGLAMNIAGQVDRYKTGSDSMFIEGRFTSHLATKQDWNERVDFGAYKIACLFTAFLIEKFTLNKILEVVAKTEKNYYALHFEDSVLRILGKPISDLENDFVSWSNKIS